MMAASITLEDPKETLVAMGKIATGQAPERMRSVLGSCIGLALYHPRLQVGAFAHIVLPDSAGRTGSPGKFADTAVPHMITLLERMGATVHGLTAKVAGGANMFNGSGPLQIGTANVEAVARALETAGIRIAAKDVGGTHGRRVTLDCDTGRLIVESAGKTPQVL